MARNNQGDRNNNSGSNNQRGENRSGGVMTIAREQPARAAVYAAAAVGAGVFLWSRRNQISDQISNLSEQFGEWSQNSGSSGGSASLDSDTAGLTTGNTGSAGMSETGGGNASLGTATGGGGGGGATSSATGRGQVRQSPTT